MGSVLTRRNLGKIAGGLAAGSALAACGGRAAPASSQARVRLTLQSLVSGNTTVQHLLQQAVSSFTAKNPGIDVQVVDRQFSGNIPQIIAGAADDIVWDNNPAAYLGDNKLLMNLDHYIQRDNVDVSAWSAGQIQSYKLAGSNSLYMLPAYMGPFCYTIRLDDFDAAGLPYPDPDWDYKAFAQTAHQLTQIQNGQRRYGTVVNYYSNSSMQTVTFMLAGFGGSMTDPAGTRQTLSTPEAIAAGRWLFEELLLPGYAVTRNNAYAHPGGYEGFLVQNGTSMQQIWTQVLQDAQTYGTQFKWDYYPFPVLPKGRLTYGTLDFYGISASTKHPDQAWELLKWVSYAPDMQRALMRVWGQTPALNALWQEWQQVIVSIAPIMAHKQLHWFQDAAAQGYAMPQQFFHAGDALANQIQGQWMAKITNHQMDVAGAFAQADNQVNAMLAAYADQQARAAGVAQRFPTDGPPVAQVPLGI